MYLWSEVFDLKPSSGLYPKNSAHLSNFLTPRTVSPGFTARRVKIAEQFGHLENMGAGRNLGVFLWPRGPAPKGLKSLAQGFNPGDHQIRRFALIKAHECAFEEKHPVHRVGDAEGAREHFWLDAFY
jgi:hypothetical protein